MGSRSHRSPDTDDPPGRPRRLRRASSDAVTRAGAVSLTAAVLLAGCAGSGTPGAATGRTPAAPSPSADAATETEPAATLRLTLELDRMVDQGLLVQPAQVITAGDGPTATEVVSAFGGQITVTSGPTGGPALRFPEFSRSRTAPMAVITVASGSTGWMDPEDLGFRFGADVVLDEVSWASARDNGNNVVQRGLYNDTSQFKLQVDRGRPSCAFKGDQGRVYVGADRKLRPGVWYRLECARQGDELIIAVGRVRPNGTVADVREKRVSREVGSMSFATTTPVSVGGKVSGAELAGAVDQFNGAISRVFVGPW